MTMRIACALAAFLTIWIAGFPATAQTGPSSDQQDRASIATENGRLALSSDDGSPNRRCKKKGSAIRTVGMQASFSSYQDVGSTALSAFAENRICERSGFQWSILGAFDRVESRGRITTAGRVGGGLYKFWQIGTGKQEPTWTQNLGIGMNALIGYEDFNIVEIAPGGNLRARRGKRPTGILDTYVALTSNNASRVHGFPPPDTVFTVETHLYFVNKRAPSANLPAFLNEEYFVGSSTVSIDHFIDHHPFGSRLQFLLQYQHLFADRSLVRDLGMARIQWRPQRNPAYDNPDVFAIGLGYRVGRHYSGLILDVSKTF
jgi:hypothetical protein